MNMLWDLSACSLGHSAPFDATHFSAGRPTDMVPTGGSVPASRGGAASLGRATSNDSRLPGLRSDIFEMSGVRFWTRFSN